MSYILSAAFSHTASALRRQSFRLFTRSTQPLKETLTRRSPNATQSSVSPGRGWCSRSYDLNTNVAKDVVLFKYENPKFYKILNIFAACQFVFWTYLSHFAFTTLKDAPIEQTEGAELAWYQRINLGENKYRNGIAICCFLIGYGIMGAAWMFTLRSVRFLILRKGGNDVAIVTYGPFNQNRIMTVPLKSISAQEAREAAKVQLPLKVKNRTLFYLLDMRGEFKNPRLFDYTAGLRRKI